MPKYKSHHRRVVVISASFPDKVVEPGHSVTAKPPPVVVARLLGRFRPQVLGGGGGDPSLVLENVGRLRLLEIV